MSHLVADAEIRASAAFSPGWRGILPLIVLPAAVLLLVPPTWPRWALMGSLAFVIYCGCKWLTWQRADLRSARVSAWRHFAYLAAWPGLDAAEFLRAAPPAAKPSAGEWFAAFAKLGIGVLLLGAGSRVPADWPYLVGWVAMVGIVLTLHFGLFHVLSCAWRAVGVVARPLMLRPLVSTSLGEFWGRRWNTAFRDLTHRLLFRPLAVRIGVSRALGVGFLFSGLVHDLVISLPAGGGYGGPTLFFAVQGIGMLFERSRVGRGLRLGSGWRGWLYTMALLLAPVPLLFHRPFVTRVIVPFFEAIGFIG